MQEWICVVALVLQLVAPYAIWRSRWNIPAHINLGFCVTAYIVPGLLTDVWSTFDESVIDQYAIINVVGACSMVAGVLCGGAGRPTSRMKSLFARLFTGEIDAQVFRRVEFFVFVGAIGMCAAYAIMGFIPMFAAAPLVAKQFKGEYHDAYYRAAYLFRFSFSTLVACLPLIFTVWWATRRRKSLLLGVSAVLLIAISLARGSTATGLLIFIGILVAYRARWFKTYLFFLLVVFPLGSAAYLLLGLAMGVESLTQIYSFDSIFDIVSSGSPDIFDQLSLLTGFQDAHPFTYGRTFFGGLVPGNYMWNPSVWTLTYDDLGADISDTVSGGLRLSAALWGYVSFGWVGVVLLPFISGWINGFFISIIKCLPLEKSIIGAALVLILYLTLGKQLSEFYLMSIHSLPEIACLLFICFGYKSTRISAVRK